MAKIQSASNWAVEHCLDDRQTDRHGPKVQTQEIRTSSLYHSILSYVRGNINNNSALWYRVGANCRSLVIAIYNKNKIYYIISYIRLSLSLIYIENQISGTMLLENYDKTKRLPSKKQLMSLCTGSELINRLLKGTRLVRGLHFV